MADTINTAFITHNAQEYIRADNRGTKNVGQLQKMKPADPTRAGLPSSPAHLPLPDPDAPKLPSGILRYFSLPHEL